MNQSSRLTLLFTVVPAAALAAGPFGLAYQLTHSVNADPTFSPDGKRLIYVSEIEGKEQLFVMDVDGKNQKQITREPYNHEDPAWSPDGRKVAFVSNRTISRASTSLIRTARGWSPSLGRTRG